MLQAQISAPTRHPFVAVLVQGRRFEEGLKALEDRRLEPIEEAIIQLQGAHSKEEHAQALVKARTVPLQGCDTDLALIFLTYWSVATWHFPEYEQEGRIVMARAKSLLTSKTPAELRALIHSIEGIFETDRTGNHELTIELFHETLRLLGRESPRYNWHLLCLARLLARNGRLGKIKSEVDQLLARTGSRYRLPIAVYRFCDAAECGRIEEALRWHAEASRDPATNQALDLYERPIYCTTLQLMRDPRSLAGENPPLWVLQVLDLLERKSAEALKKAREDELKFPNRSLLEFGFNSLGLLRAELANGHAEAARRLLTRRRALGNRHYLDDLFFARSAVLEGRWEAASRHFAAVLQAAEFYGAQRRVDFELSLACELSSGDVSRLFREAAAFREVALFRESEAPERAATPAARAPQTCGSFVAQLAGASPALKQVRHAVARFAPLDATVLITGETGTGKELVAHALHEAGPRGARPFVAVNCGAIAETLLESELFGHARGAFTGAAREHLGFFEQAGTGTVFLDEIGEISPRLQAALLRVLETGELRPVGGSASRRVACRVLAATNADLEKLAHEGRFRRDLLFRLKGLEIAIPPLRERREDILTLMEHFLSADRADGYRPTLAQEVQDALLAYAWPGNVRELRSVAELMRLLNSECASYGMDALELVFPQARRAAGPLAASAPRATENPEEVLEQSRAAWRQLDRLRELFRAHGKMNRSEAARMLGVSPKTATGYLKVLCQEGLIQKLTPSASPRSHHFALRECRAFKRTSAKIPAAGGG